MYRPLGKPKRRVIQAMLALVGALALALTILAAPASAAPGDVQSASGRADGWNLSVRPLTFLGQTLPIGKAVGIGEMGGYKWSAPSKGCVFGLGWDITVVSTEPEAVYVQCIQQLGPINSLGYGPWIEFPWGGGLHQGVFYLEEGDDGHPGYVGYWNCDNVSCWWEKTEANVTPVQINIAS